MAILRDLSESISQNQEKLTKWYLDHKRQVKLPVYASVDLRNSGFKISAVDTNLFPAGFNNIYARDLQVASSIMESYLKKNFGKIEKILLVPELHTRNEPYMQNICCLNKLFEQAGFEVRIGVISSEMRKDFVDVQVGQKTLKIFQCMRSGNRLTVKDFDPDLILINNDFSAGLPEILVDIEQPTTPPIKAGWFHRKKSAHFEILHRLINEAADLMNIDPWLMQVETQLVPGINIQSLESRERLAQVTGDLLEKIQKRYDKMGIKEEPYVFLKDNSGTYGIAVVSIKNPNEILHMNSKMRKKMARGKGGTDVGEILIQEGVPTKDLINDCPAEPVIYLAGGEVIGGFFRKHCDQDELGSLNVKGMLFSLLTFSSPLESAPSDDVFRDDIILQVYGNFARIAYLAAAYEIKDLTA